MTHTPGPWQWMNRYGFNGNVDGDLHAGARDEHGWDDGCVVVLHGTGWEADGVAASASDARLIAAAPDLYDALKAARREHIIVDDCFYTCAAAKYEDGEWATCNNDSGEHKCSCGADAINAIIDAALAKAEQP